MTQDMEARRTKLYKWAVGLSIIYVADGAFMAWALLKGGWATLGYGQVSYFPVFIPAFLAGLVVSGMYLRGFTRHGWTAHKAEWLFFFLLVDAVAAKVIVFIHRQCCQYPQAVM
ncbi:MAG: hypothetical protein V4617_01735 [Gemmatimonadota bacterium]